VGDHKILGNSEPTNTTVSTDESPKKTGERSMEEALAGGTDERWMEKALALAREAERMGEVPIGAVIVCDGREVACGFNSLIENHDPTGHAEMVALRGAGKALQNYRLTGATLYVTLEPCPMCAGALVNARIGRLVFGSRDLRFGGVRSKFQIADSDLLNHRVEVTEGVLGAECTALLKNFFEAKRR
jgi:tRNA(adenine34) deaminase